MKIMNNVASALFDIEPFNSNNPFIPLLEHFDMTDYTTFNTQLMSFIHHYLEATGL
jgi:hypothetical protein